MMKRFLFLVLFLIAAPVLAAPSLVSSTVYPEGPYRPTSAFLLVNGELRLDCRFEHVVGGITPVCGLAALPPGVNHRAVLTVATQVEQVPSQAVFIDVTRPCVESASNSVTCGATTYTLWPTIVRP